MTTTAQQPAAFELTEAGNGERFAARHGTKIRYLWPWQKWVVWNGTRWILDDLGAVERLALETCRAMKEAASRMEDRTRADALWSWAHSSESHRRLQNMLALAKSDPAIAARPEQFDVDPFLFNVENATIQLPDGRAREHDRQHHITKIAPVRYDPEAECPLWLATLERVFRGRPEVIGFMQRWFGLCLTGDTSEQCFTVFHGSGCNGKTTITETIRALAGDYGTKANFQSFLANKNDGPRNDLARLRGSRFVLASEVDQGRKLSEALVKELTGGEAITARFLFKEEFTYVPEFKITLSCNHKPVISGTDDGIWRRVKLVPFDERIGDDEKDPDLGQKLKAELPGILNWCIDGCRAWKREGLNAPAIIASATTEYRQSSDPLAEFLSARCILLEGIRVGRADLWTDYAAWAKASGERHPLERGALYDAIRRVPGVTESQWRQAGNPIRGFTGIGLCATNQNS